MLTITIRGKVGTGKTTLAVWLHHALSTVGADVHLEDPNIGSFGDLRTEEASAGLWDTYVERLLRVAKTFRHLGRIVVKTEQAPRVE